MFLEFANFYRRFIQRFSWITALLTLILKTSGSTEPSTQLGEGIVGVGGDSKARRDTNKLDRSKLDGNEVHDGEVEVDEVGKKVQKTTKSKKAAGPSDFLIPGAKLAFTKLRQAFLKALILHYFDSERYIWIKTDASSYAIGGVLSQLIPNDLGQWHSIAFFSRKMIPAETKYETYDGELLAILKPSRLGCTTKKGLTMRCLYSPTTTTSNGS